MKPIVSVSPLLKFALLLVMAPQAFAQAGSPQPCPDATAGTLGCELIAWSGLQTPVPLPEPDSKPSTPTDRRPASQRSQAANSRAQPQANRQSITGIIVKEGEKYILKAGDSTTYQLDDQDRARQYQDKRVRVVGSVDADSNTLHIESIDLVS
jgi:Protein of unknown function (DUF5818)